MAGVVRRCQTNLNCWEFDILALVWVAVNQYLPIIYINF